VFLTFLKRLTRHPDRKIHLIVDMHPVHRRVMVRDWLAEHADNIQMHFLPGYSPSSIPVELLNGDLKRHVPQANPVNKAELAAEADRHLRRRQNQPRDGESLVKALFAGSPLRRQLITACFGLRINNNWHAHTYMTAHESRPPRLGCLRGPRTLMPPRGRCEL
jgi:hypothetical protein